MKLKDTRDAYYLYTGKTSDIIRYLGLAGIGIIWIFRVEGTDKISLAQNLLFPIALTYKLLLLTLVLKSFIKT